MRVCVFNCLAVIAVSLISVAYADDHEEGKGSVPAGNDSLLEIASVESDTGFARFVDIEQVHRAYVSLNSVALADAALSLADGERALLRNHFSGLTSAGLMEYAGQIASQTGDKSTLERLVKGATNGGNSELAAMLRAMVQTAETSRGADEKKPLKIDYMNALLTGNGSNSEGVASALESLRGASRSFNGNPKYTYPCQGIVHSGEFVPYNGPSFINVPGNAIGVPVSIQNPTGWRRHVVYCTYSGSAQFREPYVSALWNSFLGCRTNITVNILPKTFMQRPQSGQVTFHLYNCGSNPPAYVDQISGPNISFE